MKTIPQHALTFLDSWLALRSEWAEIPGFVVAISKGGEIVFNHAYGSADVEAEEPLTTDHAFRIASQSKTFTATAIMQLQEAGKVRIDDPVVNYLDWLKEHKDARWKYVTLRQLLSHSAGVIRDGLDADYWQLMRPFPDHAALRAAILEADLVIEPNTTLKYSNYGYSLLGMIVEAASGMSYADYVRGHIIEPLGLTQTDVDYVPTRQLTSGYTHLTKQRTRIKVPNVTTGAMAPATGFCSTARDLCRYFAAQRIGSGELLSDVSKREMQHRHWEVPMSHDKGSYGLGFEYARYDKQELAGHGGGFPGYITQTLFDGDDELVITVLTNCNGYIGDMLGGIVSVVSAWTTDASAVLAPYEGRFTSLWGSYEIVAVDNELRGIWPNSWWPFSSYETLSVVDEQTLVIKSANGFSNQGEVIKFHRDDNGKTLNIICGGMTMVPSIDGDVRPTWM